MSDNNICYNFPPKFKVQKSYQTLSTGCPPVLKMDHKEAVNITPYSSAIFNNKGQIQNMSTVILVFNSFQRFGCCDMSAAGSTERTLTAKANRQQVQKSSNMSQVNGPSSREDQESFFTFP